MAETIIRCPACRIGIKIKAIPPGKKAFACPKCRTAVAYPKPAPEPEPEEEVLEVEAGDDEEEAAPAPRRRVRRDNDDKATPARRPRRRPVDDDEDEEEEERPRRRKKRKAAADRTWLWPVVLVACLLVALFVMGVFYVARGGEGFPEAQDGPPITKYIVLAFVVVMGAVVAVFGTSGVVTQRITIARYFFMVKVWEEEHRGVMAIVIGSAQCLVGSVLIGTGLYGLLF